MKRFTMILGIFSVLVLTPALTLAHCGSCEHEQKGGQKVAANHEGHSGMAAAGNMLDLGSVTVKGVEGMAHLKDVRAAMAKMGMNTTHHFMVMFSDEQSGKAIETGTVAVKITRPEGTVTGPLALVGMQGHFGADVTLDKPGAYLFAVGSKLADGTSRQFEFKMVIK